MTGIYSCIFLGITKSVEQNFLYFMFFAGSELLPFCRREKSRRKERAEFLTKGQNICKNMVCWIHAGLRSCFPIEFAFYIWLQQNVAFVLGEGDWSLVFRKIIPSSGLGKNYWRKLVCCRNILNSAREGMIKIWRGQFYVFYPLQYLKCGQAIFILKWFKHDIYIYNCFIGK